MEPNSNAPLARKKYCQKFSLVMQSANKTVQQNTGTMAAFNGLKAKENRRATQTDLCSRDVHASTTPKAKYILHRKYGCLCH